MTFPEIFKIAASLPDSTTTINGNEYEFCVLVMNSDGEYIQLANKFIRNLMIEDDLFSPFSYGVMLLDNRFDAFENFHIRHIAGGTETDRPRSFQFKHDGYDLVIVKLMPIFTEDNAPPKVSEETFPERIWDMSYIFSIYDEDERHITKSIDRKIKILYLKDIKEQILSQTNLKWSTSNLLDVLGLTQSEVSQVSDSRRAVAPGTCIKDIINSAFKDKRFLNADITNDFEDSWEVGGTKMFYSSTAQSSAMDDIENVLDNMVSEGVYDNCILQYTRHRAWSLLPFSQYFDRIYTPGTRLPGDFHIDIFPISQLDGDEGEDEERSIKGMTRNSFDLKMNIDEFVGISNYSFANMSSADSVREMTSHAVHSYNPTTKTFSMELEKHNISNIKKDFRELYVQKMAGDDPSELIPASDDEKENKIINHVFDGQSDWRARYKLGRNRVMKQAIALNAALTFDVPGLTYRRSGRFVSIVNAKNVPDVPYQDIFQGQWLITNVVHNICGSRYQNTVTCTKPYSYREVFSK